MLNRSPMSILSSLVCAPVMHSAGVIHRGGAYLVLAPAVSRTGTRWWCCGLRQQGVVEALPFHLEIRAPSSPLDGINSVLVVPWTRGKRPQRKRIFCTASEEESELPGLQVPVIWTSPDAAVKEAEWLRGALRQWLDDEYCPEPANEEISKRCASVFYYCLLEKQLDVADILMEMVSNLETFSFKESFHGPFSSANAAVELIIKRMNRALGDCCVGI